MLIQFYVADGVIRLQLIKAAIHVEIDIYIYWYFMQYVNMPQWRELYIWFWSHKYGMLTYCVAQK